MSAKKVDERPGLSELASDANFVAGYWRRVRKGGGVPPHAPELGECWHWTGGTMKFGYGVLRKGRRGRTILAHRLAYALGRSIPPAKLCVCHKCDNPSCCNPSHWFLGTRLDNVRDMISKGRRHILTSEESGKTKLTREQVTEIRELEAKGDLTNKQIGALYGISGVQVCRISRFKRWKD